MSQKPKFEKQMERLQRIVDELEKGDVSLEKSVLLYKEGQTLLNLKKLSSKKKQFLNCQNP